MGKIMTRRDLRRFLRGLDKQLGRLWDVILLAIFRKPKASLAARPETTPQRVLWIRVDRLGDLLMNTALFGAFKQRYPDAQQDILCSVRNREVADANPVITETLVYPKNNPIGVLRVLSRLRRSRYDWVIDLNDAWSRTTALICRVAGAGEVFGTAAPVHRQRAVRFYDRIMSLPGPLHQRQLTEQWARQLGLRLDDPSPVFPLRDAESREARDLIASMHLAPKGQRTRPVVGLHMGNQMKQRDTYPLDLSIRLARRLGRRYALVALCGPNERRDTQRLVDESQTEMRLMPPLSIPQVAALLSQLDAVIIPCTGPLHLAQAVRTPAVALCRRFNYDYWRPLEPPHRSLVGATGDTVAEIPVEQIEQTLEALLADLVNDQKTAW
jgi:ADP-heptose:LPS heptosyltransferase